ncbi:hypothetical protein SB861_25015 [Paraburkholderia sp. SIMBA_049]
MPYFLHLEATHRAGNGYLLDQFINTSSNNRDDAYGGSIKNRTRTLFEVVQAVSDEVSAETVAVRLTLMGRFMGMNDDTPEATFGYIAQRLNEWKFSYLHLVEPAVVGTVKDENVDPWWDDIMKLMRKNYRDVMMLAGGYTRESAEQAIASGHRPGRIRPPLHCESGSAQALA